MRLLCYVSKWGAQQMVAFLLDSLQTSVKREGTLSKTRREMCHVSSQALENREDADEALDKFCSLAALDSRGEPRAARLARRSRPRPPRRPWPPR